MRDTQEKLNSYPLFVALTRTPMIMGVTQTFFTLNITGCSAVFPIALKLMGGAAFIFVLGFFIISHIIGMIFCIADPRYFEILSRRLDMLSPNAHFWGCRSYDPS